MKSFDEFSSQLLEESKRFLEKAIETSNPPECEAYLHSSILIGMSSLEAYINGISDELLTYPDIPLVEESLLSEKDIDFQGGRFIITNRLKIYRITDRISFLYFKFKKKELKGDEEEWWADLKSSIKLRNDLVHPKSTVDINIKNTERLVQSIIDCLLCLSSIIYKKPFPFKNLGLSSKLTF